MLWSCVIDGLVVTAKSLPPYNRKVAVLRFLALTMLTVWVGGLATLGAIAAPVIFAVLESHDPLAGRELAGTVFGAVFERFLSASLVCGVLVLLLLGIRAAIGPRPSRLGVRVWLVVAMLAVTAGSWAFVIPRINATRRGTAGPIAGLRVDDPRRVAFGRLHALSNGLMLLTLAGGLVLVWFEGQDTH
jgi:hypothetical protein